MKRSWWRPAAGFILLVVAVIQFGNAAFILGKATLAQRLLEQAWRQSSSGTEAIHPWTSADTFPVARLTFPRQQRDYIVLSGASGRNLAFGPTHVSHSAWPGEGGAIIIAGHRDTHFEVLSELVDDDVIELERHHRRNRYRVERLEVLHESRADALDQSQQDRLILVTCYPFAAIDPGTPWRFVVTAVPDEAI
ncbi:MAG: class GN sortase [Gammaproteobacteria bacterium]